MIFECLAHNLLLLFEHYLGQSEGMRHELEVKKRQGRAKAAALASATAGIVQSAENFINTALVRATQRTQQRTPHPALQPLGTGLGSGFTERLPGAIASPASGMSGAESVLSFPH